MEKSNFEAIKISTLDELFNTINDHFRHWPSYIFRGHAQSDWLLESTLTRSLKKIIYPNKEELVQEHLDKFKLEIRSRRGTNPKQLADDELWALGQHYGLYTPLLDWSQSPYVALFFALSKKEKSPTGLRTLWGLNTSDIETINAWYKAQEKNNKLWRVELINPIIDDNSRLVGQNGLFTKSGIQTDIEKWVINGPNLEWVSLYRIDFPEEIRDEAIAALDLMNINYSALFPDLLGSSLNCNSTLEQRDYFEDNQQKIWDEFEKTSKPAPKPKKLERKTLKNP